MADQIESLIEQDIWLNQQINKHIDRCSNCTAEQFAYILQFLSEEDKKNAISCAIRSKNLVPILYMLREYKEFNKYIPDIILYSCKHNRSELVNVLLRNPEYMLLLSKYPKVIEECLRLTIYYNNQPLFLFFNATYNIPISLVYELFQREMICLSVFYGFPGNITPGRY